MRQVAQELLLGIHRHKSTKGREERETKITEPQIFLFEIFVKSSTDCQSHRIVARNQMTATPLPSIKMCRPHTLSSEAKVILCALTY